MNINSDKKMQEEAQRIVDSNQLKNMLSIFNAYILRNPSFTESCSQPSENAFYMNIFKMICEILN